MRKAGILIICAALLGLFGRAASAQVLSGALDGAAPAAQKPAAAAPSSPKSASGASGSMFPTTQTNFNGEADYEAPKDDPRVIHFKIVDGKVTADDPENRKVLVYYDNYQIHRGFDKFLKCSIRVYVINDLKENITSLGFRLKWPDISTAVEMRQVKRGAKTYTDLMLLGDGCLHLDKTPTIEVNRCRVRGLSQQQCADAIQWLPR